ncbi:unnamed protein product [Symbiodinium necroappetens]|uniref:Uncharacterized protein n=1 Tax=Symbiodinium necroappetens TaxID=1628268 RepID=A0A813BY26_9DINO|nr:unnamed protein product [Symbiodinium necroappetens]
MQSLEQISEKAREPVPESKDVVLDEAPVPVGAHVRLWRHLKHSWNLLQTHVGLISRKSVPDPAILILGLLTTIIALTLAMAFCSAAPVPRPKVEETKRPVTRCPAPTAEQLASAGRRAAPPRTGPDPGVRVEGPYPPPGAAQPYSSVSVRAASATSLPPPKRPSHVGGEAGAMFSWSPRSSDEEDTLCPCLVVPDGMEFVFAVREVLTDERQELSFSVVDLEGSPLSHIIVNESGSGPQCGIFLQMLDREPLASVRTDMLFERAGRLPEILLPSGEVFCAMERDGSREYVLRDQRKQRLLRLQGNFRDKAVKVINASGQLVALSERCVIAFDGGSHYQVRVAPHADAGLVLCRSWLEFKWVWQPCRHHAKKKDNSFSLQLPKLSHNTAPANVSNGRMVQMDAVGLQQKHGADFAGGDRPTRKKTCCRAMVSSTTYLPPIPVGPLATVLMQAVGLQHRNQNVELQRRYFQRAGAAASAATEETLTSVARIVNKTEARKKKEGSKPRKAASQARLRLPVNEPAPVKSSSTPVLPKLKLDSESLENEAGSRILEEEAAQPPTPPENAETQDFPGTRKAEVPAADAEMAVSGSGLETKDASEDQEAEAEALEQPILVAPWKRGLSKKGTKSFKRMDSHLIFEPRDADQEAAPQEVDPLGDDLPAPEQSEGQEASPPSPDDAGAKSSRRSSGSQSSELDDFGHSMNKGWSKAKQAARLAATLRPENMLDTVQQWRKWCRKTDQVFDAAPQTSTWRGAEATARSIRDLDEELSVDKDRLRLMIQQGVHRSKNGLKLTVRHVQPDIDRETLWRNRRETLERVDTHGKRIQQALQDSLRARKDLRTCVQLLKETMTEKPDTDKKKPRVSSKERKCSWSSGRLDTIKKKLEEYIRTGSLSDYEEDRDEAAKNRKSLIT